MLLQYRLFKHSPFVCLCLAVALLLCMASGACAQFFRQAPPPPGSYQGYWNPYYAPQGFDARIGKLKFVNFSKDWVEIYHQDKFKRWNWAARLAPGASQTFRSPVGDYWVAHDRYGHVIKRAQTLRRPQTVKVRISGYFPHPTYRPGIGIRRVDVLFKNLRRRPLDLYALTRDGRWTWVGRLGGRGGEIRVKSFPGQRWKAVDSRGRLVITYRSGGRPDTVPIR